MKIVLIKKRKLFKKRDGNGTLPHIFTCHIIIPLDFNIISIGLKSTVHIHVCIPTHTIIPNSFLEVLQYHLPICLSPQCNISPMRHQFDTGIFFPHWKSYKVTNSFHPYPKIKNSKKCNSFMPTYVNMSTSCTAIKNMSIS